MRKVLGPDISLKKSLSACLTATASSSGGERLTLNLVH